MARSRTSAVREEERKWSERDELQRLDFIAAVIAPTSLAGCAAAAALIATDNLTLASSLALGFAGILLIICAVEAAVVLRWSPHEEQNGLGKLIAAKRVKTSRAFAVLIVAVLLGFGLTALFEVADAGNAEGAAKNSLHSAGDRAIDGAPRP